MQVCQKGVTESCCKLYNKETSGKHIQLNDVIMPVIDLNVSPTCRMNELVDY